MAQNHRAPRADVIYMLPAVRIPKVGALGAADKAGRAANGFKCANRGVDPAWDTALGAFEQGDIVVLDDCAV